MQPGHRTEDYRRSILIAIVALTIGAAAMAQTTAPAVDPPAATQPAPVDHAALARQAIGEGRPADAWVHARRAVQTRPGDAQAAQVFVAFWLGLDQRGTFNAGHALEDILVALGQPDARYDQDDVVRLVYGYMAIDFKGGLLMAVVDLRGLDPNAIAVREQVDLVTDDRPWRMGHQQINRVQVNTEYVLPDQSVQDWRELFSIQRLIGLATAGVTMEDYRREIRSAFQQRAPNGAWKIIRESERELVYEFIVPEGGKHPAQHEIARIIRGEYDFHRVAYAQKGAAMEDELRRGWLDRLDRAQLRAVQAAAPVDDM